VPRTREGARHVGRATRSGAVRQRTPDTRLVTLLHRLRWPVVITWLIAIVALNGLSSSLSKAANDTASAHLPAAAASTKVALLQQRHLGGQSQTDTAIVVAARDSGLTRADQAALGAARTAVAGCAGLVSGMAAPGPLQSSPDGKAAVSALASPGPSSGENIDDDAVRAVRSAIAGPLGKVGTGLAFAVTGSAAIYADGNAENQQTRLLLTAADHRGGHLAARLPVSCLVAAAAVRRDRRDRPGAGVSAWPGQRRPHRVHPVGRHPHRARLRRSERLRPAPRPPVPGGVPASHHDGGGDGDRAAPPPCRRSSPRPPPSPAR